MIAAMTSSSPDAGTRAIVWFTIAVLGLCFLVTEHTYDISRRDAYTVTEEEMEEQAGGGNTSRRIAFLCIAALGAACLVTPTRKEFPQPNLLAILLFALLGWCAISVLWSIDVSMTIRRLIVLGCCAVGALGLSRQLTLREMAFVGLVISTGSLVMGVAVELSLGTFRPWAGDYRFSGTLHPNTQGLYLATMCFSSFSLLRAGAKPRTLLLALFGAGFTFLVLTKSRTSTAGMLVGLAAIVTVGKGGALKWITGLLGTYSAAVAALILLLAGVDLATELRDMALMGREEQAESLTGRVPIWTELTPFALKRPFLGYGYDSFWTPEHIDIVSSTLQWGIREAHSGYFDAVLSIGLIGAMLGVACALTGLATAAASYLRTGAPGYGFAFAMLVFALINAFTESGMTMPFFGTFLIASGLFHLALDGGPEEERGTPTSQTCPGEIAFREPVAAY